MRGASWRLQLPAGGRLRRVLAAYALNGLIEFATWLAILLVAYAEGGPVLVGVASFAMLLPAIALVPVLAGFGDRLPRGRALSLSYTAVSVSATATGTLLLLDAPLWSVLIGGALLTVSISLVRPMHFAATPLIARRPGDLVAANGLSSALDGVAVFTGFVLAGLLTEAVGAWVVLLSAGALALLAALLTSRLGLPAVVVPDGDGVSEIREAFRGFASLRGSWGAVALLLLLAATSVVEGSNDVLTVTFNDQVLGRDASTAGLLAGSYGIGLALGGATLAGLAHRRWVAPIVLAGALLLGMAEASVSLTSRLGPAAALLALVGCGVSMVLVSARTLLQRSTDPAVLARVLAIQEGVYLAGLTAGAVVGPVLIALMGPARAFVPLGVLIAAMGLLAFRAIRTLDRRAPSHRREVALLSRVPFLAALPPYELERLAADAQWRNVPAGVAVVTQGESGNAYFLVARGELSVSVDDELRPHTLTEGDGFGEIALLRSVPRTATVRALVDTGLLEIGAQAFLGAVTSDVDGSGLAQFVVEDRLAADGRSD